MSTHALVVSDVSVAYNGRPALEDMTFQLEAGQRVAVVGPNGAGKSTLFKVIAGVLRPQTGSVRTDGHGSGHPLRIAYVPQRSQIDWNFPVTVSDVVMMGRVGNIGLFHWPRRADWEWVQRSLAQVGMQDFARRQIGELSGGQQQRVFVARALAQQAELLLLDEPFSGLDVEAQEAIVGILDGMAGQGITVMVALHDLDMAAHHFDAVLLINRRLIAFGPPQQALLADTLLRAYGGHLHVLATQNGQVALADDCCGEGEAQR